MWQWIGRIRAFIVTWNVACITVNGRQMITFEVYRWKNAKAGKRNAFRAYGLRADPYDGGNIIDCSKGTRRRLY